MSLFVKLNNCIRYSLTFLCMRISLTDSRRRFMYPIMNICSGIANTEAICFAKIAVFPLLLAVSTDVKSSLCSTKTLVVISFLKPSACPHCKQRHVNYKLLSQPTNALPNIVYFTIN